MTESTSIPQRRGVPLYAQIVVWVLLIGLLVIVALQLRHTQQGTAQPGQKIENFALTLYSGYEYEGKTSIHVADLRGKVVVINFWASWCKPCEQEAADLKQAWDYYSASSDKVIFIGADYVDTEPEARVYLKKFGITYPNGPDLATKISQYFRIQGVPETYFIDKNGVLQYVQIGPFTSLEQIKGILDPMLLE
jgi:cytochrome c biogenesis protein CcmG, thiol:disulfide interchange protein DsbE